MTVPAGGSCGGLPVEIFTLRPVRTPPVCNRCQVAVECRLADDGRRTWFEVEQESRYPLEMLRPGL